MKVNYKNTALGLLTKMDLTQFRIVDDGGETDYNQKVRLAQSIVRIWPNMSPRFANKIRFMSEPFYLAYEKSCHKLADVIDAEDIDESGVIIFKASKSETNTVFYSLQTWGKGKEYEMDATVMIFNNSTHENKPSLGIISQRRPGMPVGGARFYAAESAQKAGVTPISTIADILTMVLFIKYCELETKIIKAGKKENHIGIKYLNETSQQIEILDSTWFTTIVRSEGFNVRGHFRFQPCGHNLSERKLIWVSDYEKNGYTKNAKILNQ